jgi:pheromone shutdown protein TraB
MVASSYFEDVLKPYYEISQPPEALNNLMLSRIKSSNFLFTTGYLTLPFLMIIYLIWWIRKKDTLSATGFILAGTAGLNAFVHNISGAGPLDRYFFCGYPLVMAAWICGLIAILRFMKREKPSSSKIEATTTND